MPEPAATPRVVVFDFDGVLVRGDSFESFLRWRLRAHPWRGLPALPLLPFVPLLLRSAWGKGWLARLFTRLATWGDSEASFRRAVATFAGRFGADAANFHADGIAVLQAHRAAGDRVIVASASEHGLLGALLSTLGLGEVEHLGSDVAVTRFGLHVRRHHYGAMKPVALAEHYGLSRWDIAYSDAWSDLPLLEQADEAVVVNPSAELAERFRETLGDKLRVVAWC